MNECDDQHNYVKVKRALISVSDKSGIGEFASTLREQGVELLSTGGTYRLLQELGLRVVPLHRIIQPVHELITLLAVPASAATEI